MNSSRLKQKTCSTKPNSIDATNFKATNKHYPCTIGTFIVLFLSRGRKEVHMDPLINHANNHRFSIFIQGKKIRSILKLFILLIKKINLQHFMKKLVRVSASSKNSIRLRSSAYRRHCFQADSLLCVSNAL